MTPQPGCHVICIQDGNLEKNKKNTTSDWFVNLRVIYTTKKLNSSDQHQFLEDTNQRFHIAIISS